MPFTPENFAQTDKQVEIMQIILAAMDKGERIDTNLIRSRLSYEATRHAAISSLRYLEVHGFITRTRASKNNGYEIRPTLKAYQHFRPGPISGIDL